MIMKPKLANWATACEPTKIDVFSRILLLIANLFSLESELPISQSL